MDPGIVRPKILFTALFAIGLSLVSIFTELVYMLCKSKHRTSLAVDSQRGESNDKGLSLASSSREISMSEGNSFSRNPTDGGMLNAFV